MSALWTATDEWIAEMTNNDYVRKHYTVSDVDGRTLRGYGVVMLSRLPMPRLAMWWLPSNMGRSALIATSTINNETVRPFPAHGTRHTAPHRTQSTRTLARY
jgi:endonuclease/exonuclease/phosphatase family metal-dependent hydrolase